MTDETDSSRWIFEGSRLSRITSERIGALERTGGDGALKRGHGLI